MITLVVVDYYLAIVATIWVVLGNSLMYVTSISNTWPQHLENNWIISPHCHCCCVIIKSLHKL